MSLYLITFIVILYNNSLQRGSSLQYHISHGADDLIGQYFCRVDVEVSEVNSDYFRHHIQTILASISMTCFVPQLFLCDKVYMKIVAYHLGLLWGIISGWFGSITKS